METPAMQFLYGDRELQLVIGSVLDAPVEVVVNAADAMLSHGGTLARELQSRAGNTLREESDQLIREYGAIGSGMAVYSTAGELPFKAVIHAVGPALDADTPDADHVEDEQTHIERAVSRSLQLCELNEWHSVAFPALGAEIFDVPIEICARAYFRAITRFWDARHECPVEKILVCLSETQFRPFFDAFREHGMDAGNAPDPREVADEPPPGRVDLSEQDIASLEDDDEIDEWFK